MDWGCQSSISGTVRKHSSGAQPCKPSPGGSEQPRPGEAIPCHSPLKTPSSWLRLQATERREAKPVHSELIWRGRPWAGFPSYIRKPPPITSTHSAVLLLPPREERLLPVTSSWRAGSEASCPPPVQLPLLIHVPSQEDLAAEKNP